MLTRFVRIQLTLFTIASVVGMSVLVVQYLKVPTLLGVGRIAVTMNMPDAGGLYRFANVTYRGVQIGKVTDVDVNADGAVATLSLTTSPRVPSDLRVQVRSVSAVGEQYVDLQPDSEDGPYLSEGSVIPASDVTVPKRVAPMLDRVSGLIASVPTENLGTLLDETFLAFNGAGSDLQSLTDSTARLAAELDRTSGRTAQLVEDAQPFLEGQVATSDALRTWAARLASVSRQVAANDPDLRTVLETGPSAAEEVSQLLQQVQPTLPVLLANMGSLSQVAVTYHPGLKQLLVLLPPLTAMYQAAVGDNNATGIPVGDFRISVDDPPACTVGFLPASQRRNPADTTTLDTPDGLYCKLPQDSPISVRGVRNTPCMDKPGKYAPTVEICKSDEPYKPLAAREHALGPGPFDPNLVGQGVPPDSRVNEDERIFGPITGTPLPPGASPGPGAPPAPAAPPPPIRPDNPVLPQAAAPSSFGNASDARPPLAIAPYDPASGAVAGPDGHVFSQTNLAEGGRVRTWQELVLPPASGATR
ncbi:MCE family protein [Mycobacterium sp. SMC-4]|uniref:MCE family protein n=1 Tax=Mycobacterium sp. SMC-4 TaxID=2857059 RepID=UPI0021B1EB44|nr:MlaD family protein [Mycobacterium sp. SMC-4]UXA19762.1 MCE family protein [Mycobacterium sp. SMC-4]